MIISGWQSVTKAPALNGLLSLLEISSAFCKHQAHMATGQLPGRMLAFLQSGQIQSQVGQAMASAKSPGEKARIQRAYDLALERARTGEIGQPAEEKKGKDSFNTRNLQIRPGGKAREPRAAPRIKKEVRARARDSFSSRW